MNRTPTEFDDVDEPAPVPRRSAESAPSATSLSSVVSAASPSAPPLGPDVPEVSGTPEGTPEPSGEWQRVTKAPPAVIDPDPVQDAGVPDAPPPMPRAVKVIGLVAVGLLLALAAWLGLSLGAEDPGAEPTPTPTVTQDLWELAAPMVVGDLVRGAEDTVEDPADPDRVVTRADYSDGTEQLVLLMTRPETDLPSFLLQAGVTGVSSVGSSICGTSVDTGSPVCARVQDRSGIMVLGLTDQTAEQLDAHVDAFLTVLTGE